MNDNKIMVVALGCLAIVCLIGFGVSWFDMPSHWSPGYIGGMRLLGIVIIGCLATIFYILIKGLWTLK